MKNEIWSWIGDLSQVAGIKHYELRSGRAKGTEAFDVRTGAGLAFTVVKVERWILHGPATRTLRSLLSPPTALSPPLFLSLRATGFYVASTRGY